MKKYTYLQDFKPTKPLEQISYVPEFHSAFTLQRKYKKLKKGTLVIMAYMNHFFTVKRFLSSSPEPSLTWNYHDTKLLKFHGYVQTRGVRVHPSVPYILDLR